MRIAHYDIISAVMLLFMMHHHICGICGLMDAPIHMVPYELLFFYMAYFFYKAGMFCRPEITIKEVVVSSAKRLLVNCVFACVAVNNLVQYIPQLHILPWMGRNSMVFLCIHALVYGSFSLYWFKKMSINPYAEMIICWVGVLMVCVAMTYVFKNKYLCWLIGERN